MSWKNSKWFKTHFPPHFLIFCIYYVCLLLRNSFELILTVMHTTYVNSLALLFFFFNIYSVIWPKFACRCLTLVKKWNSLPLSFYIFLIFHNPYMEVTFTWKIAQYFQIHCFSGIRDKPKDNFKSFFCVLTFFKQLDHKLGNYTRLRDRDQSDYKKCRIYMKK